MYKALDSISGDVQKELDAEKKSPSNCDVTIVNKNLGEYMTNNVQPENAEKIKLNETKIKIMCDARENGSLIKELVNMNIDCEVKNLECDFYLSSRCGVERKK